MERYLDLKFNVIDLIIDDDEKIDIGLEEEEEIQNELDDDITSGDSSSSEDSDQDERDNLRMLTRSKKR